MQAALQTPSHIILSGQSLMRLIATPVPQSSSTLQPGAAAPVGAAARLPLTMQQKQKHAGGSLPPAELTGPSLKLQGKVHTVRCATQNVQQIQTNWDKPLDRKQASIGAKRHRQSCRWQMSTEDGMKARTPRQQQHTKAHPETPN